MITAKEEFYYGALRSMKQEYLKRTIEKNLLQEDLDNETVWVNIEGSGLLGDDKVSLTMWDTEGNQTSRDTYLSTICYETAKTLAEED